MNSNTITQIISIVQESILSMDDRAIIELRTEYFRMAQLDAIMCVLAEVTKIIENPAMADAHSLARTLTKMVGFTQLLPSMDSNDPLRFTSDSPTLRRRMAEELEQLKYRYVGMVAARAAAEAEGATKQ